MKHLCAILIFVGACLSGFAEVIPPAPKAYFNDYANVVSPEVASQLNQKLEQFERETSDQIVVAVFPKMQSDSSIEDYTIRLARAWGVGQTNKNNGAVLFVFVQDRKMFLQTGYGLEGVLPDITCKRIIDDVIAPHFKTGDYNGGLTAGVQAIMAAVRGEFKGNGITVAESRGRGSNPISGLLCIGIFLVFILLSFAGSRRRRRGWFYTGSGWYGGGWGGGWGGGGGGGFSGGGGGGGFSGGGGSFGGGGAGGSW